MTAVSHSFSNFLFPAKVLSNSMDKSLNPCDDFYEYACAKWPEHNPIPKGYRSWSLFHVVQEKVQQQIQGIYKIIYCINFNLKLVQTITK